MKCRDRSDLLVLSNKKNWNKTIRMSASVSVMLMLVKLLQV